MIFFHELCQKKGIKKIIIENHDEVIAVSTGNSNFKGENYIIIL